MLAGAGVTFRRGVEVPPMAGIATLGVLTVVVAGATALPAGVKPGELLLAELRCAACHAPPADRQARLTPPPAPRLEGARGALRLLPAYVRAWLSSPPREKPGTTMPDLLHGLRGGEKARTVD